VPRPKPGILETPFAPHGGPDGATFALYDFSVNSNPFGPPPALLDLLREVDLSRYPDPTYQEAREAAARYHGVPPERVVLGSSAELIHRVGSCYLEPGRGALVAAPSFGEYARASALQGAWVRACDVYVGRAEPDVEALVRAIHAHRPTLVWLCGPNNPTGHAWTLGGLSAVAAACEGVDALLVVDAAYLELSDAPPTPLPETAVQLHSLTKTFCVPGLRVGYAVAPPPVAEVLNRAAPPWAVSAHAQAAVSWCRSPAGEAFVRTTVPDLLRLRREFQSRLSALGVDVWETSTSFFLAEVGDTADFKRRAQGAGFRVRDAASFGLPSCVRLAAQTHEANEKLLDWVSAW